MTEVQNIEIQQATTLSTLMYISSYSVISRIIACSWIDNCIPSTNRCWWDVVINLDACDLDGTTPNGQLGSDVTMWWDVAVVAISGLYTINLIGMKWMMCSSSALLSSPTIKPKRTYSFLLQPTLDILSLQIYEWTIIHHSYSLYSLGYIFPSNP